MKLQEGNAIFNVKFSNDKGILSTGNQIKMINGSTTELIKSTYQDEIDLNGVCVNMDGGTIICYEGKVVGQDFI